MINVLLNGCNGKMGQVIKNTIIEYDNMNIVAGVDINSSVENNFTVFNDINNCDKNVDVVIDFSHPLAFNNTLNYCINNKKPLVMATTGLSKEQHEKLINAANIIPVFFSANMSIGINLIMSLCKKAADFLGSNFDIEIIEKHHNQKIDAPSGTALAIADTINQSFNNKKQYIYNREQNRIKRGIDEIGIHSIRGGSIVGEHTVIFAGANEIIEIKHEALSKDIFARGALKAAQFLCNKPKGFYNMESIIKAQ